MAHWSIAPQVEVAWLSEMPEAVRDEYFVLRQRCYLDRWGSRLALDERFGLRDPFDDEYVVVALGAGERILGGVRANLARPGGDAEARRLPIEISWNIRLHDLFPDHPLHAVSYAEASRLFLREGSEWLHGPTVTLKMLDFLLDRVPGVAITYFGLPNRLLRTYKLLAKAKGIGYAYKGLDAMEPHPQQGNDAAIQWGVFACLLSQRPVSTTVPEVSR